jgi:hypothetical protein
MKPFNCNLLKLNLNYSGFLAVLLIVIISAFPQPALSDDETTKPNHELSWEMPGRVSIYDLQFGAGVLKEGQWQFLGHSRAFEVDQFKDRLTLIVKFSYRGSKPEIPLKFVLKLPDSRQYEESVTLTERKGNFSYQFTIHRPEDFIGSGSLYLYYGFSIVDVLDFTITPGS